VANERLVGDAAKSCKMTRQERGDYESGSCDAREKGSTYQNHITVSRRNRDVKMLIEMFATKVLDKWWGVRTWREVAKSIKRWKNTDIICGWDH
jgi:hypothetical protein